MTSQEYLRSSAFGGGWPLAVIGSGQSQTSHTQRPDPTQVSSLLELEALQIPDPVQKETATWRKHSSFFDEPIEEILARSGLTFTPMEWSMADFERDLDLIAEGLPDIQVDYRGSYSREDIYRDDD